MKKEELPHDYKNCSLDFQDEYVHVVQKGQFETDVFYHNINALMYEPAKQTVTIEQTGLEIKLSTTQEKSKKPFGVFLLVLSILLLGFASLVLFVFNDIAEVYDIIFVQNVALVDMPIILLVTLACILLGILFLVLSLIILIKKKKILSFKAGYDELNKRYHDAQSENVKIRKRQAGLIPPPGDPTRMRLAPTQVPPNRVPSPVGQAPSRPQNGTPSEDKKSPTDVETIKRK